MPKFIMSDARAFTDYNPSCEVNNAIQKKYNITNSHEYRSFLQKNAEKIMEDNAKCFEQTECKLCPVCKAAVEHKPPSKSE
jgi:hypothetical protein